jgi:hypothetical protein
MHVENELDMVPQYIIQFPCPPGSKGMDEYFAGLHDTGEGYEAETTPDPLRAFGWRDEKQPLSVLEMSEPMRQMGGRVVKRNLQTTLMVTSIEVI